MKKVLAICLTAILLATMSLTAMAAPNGFVSSPSGTPVPGINSAVPGHDDCTATLIITPYTDRFDLPDSLRQLFEQAYSDITNSSDLSQLIGGLKDLISGLNINGADLSVSDFFTLHLTDCDEAAACGRFDVTLDVDTLKHFVSLVRLNENGEWEVVPDAKVVGNGSHLQFTVDSAAAPYAVIVDASTGSLVAPQTGHFDVVFVGSIAMMVMCAAAFAVILVKRKENEA